MSRVYDVTFVGPDGAMLTTRGHGNTRASAERGARHRLGEQVGPLEARTCWRAVRFDYVKGKQ